MTCQICKGTGIIRAKCGCGKDHIVDYDCPRCGVSLSGNPIHVVGCGEGKWARWCEDCTPDENCRKGEWEAEEAERTARPTRHGRPVITQEQARDMPRPFPPWKD